MNSIKSQQIETCLVAVSKYYDADPVKVLTSYCANGAATRQARGLLWYHMHDCGMSYHQIGRIFGNLSVDHVSKRAKEGKMRMNEETRLLVKTLPRIDTTLDFAEA